MFKKCFIVSICLLSQALIGSSQKVLPKNIYSAAALSYLDQSNNQLFRDQCNANPFYVTYNKRLDENENLRLRASNKAGWVAFGTKYRSSKNLRRWRRPYIDWNESNPFR